MSHSNTHATLDVVHKEIDGTLQNAEKSLSRFLDDRNSGEDLQNCIDFLNQVRGIFIVVELKGAIALSEEAVQLATDIPVGANDDKNDLLSRLSDAIFVLKRYSEYLAAEKRGFPELLIDTINQIRLARKEPLLLESHFHEAREHANLDLMSRVSLEQFAPLSDFEHHAHRFRHIFQIGLLSILKKGDVDIALRLIQRAAEGATRLSIGYGMAPFWALFKELTDCLNSETIEFTDVRKRLFMLIERLFRDMASKGPESSDKEPDERLAREIAFLLGVVDPDNQTSKDLMSDIGITLDYSESERVEQQAKLSGPGANVIDSVAKAVTEDLMVIKEKLDLFERGSGVSDEEIALVADVLSRLSGILIVLNLPRLSADCSEKAQMVSSWSGGGSTVDDQQLMLVADSIIGVEAAISKYKDVGSDTDHVVVKRDPNNPFLKEARVMVVNESQSSLALTKRSITAYVESGGDKLHLANIAQALGCSRGGMFLMGSERVASIIASCEQCIRSELVDSQTMPDEKVLETLADALSSVEYYIEAMNMKSASSDELLKLSEDSLRSIGYEVAA